MYLFLFSLFIIRPTYRDVLWYEFDLRRSLSMGLSTKLVNTIQTEPCQIGSLNAVHILLMTRDRNIDFYDRGSKVKVTC